MPQGNRDLKAEARRIQQEQGVKHTEAHRRAEKLFQLEGQSANPLNEWWELVAPPEKHGLKWVHNPQDQNIKLSRYYVTQDEDFELLSCSITEARSHHGGNSQWWTMR